MQRVYRRRLISAVVAILFLGLFSVGPQLLSSLPVVENDSSKTQTDDQRLAQLAVKGRAAKTGYARAQFGDGWSQVGACDTRNIILARDLTNTTVDNKCHVLSGKLADPYTGKTIVFVRGQTTSDDVQIDHVVALSNAWQTGAQQLSFLKREAFANDPLNLLAVDGAANQQKSDGDAATWLPRHKAFRCQYVQRQIQVKLRYELWVTPAEKAAMQRELRRC